MDGFAKTHTSPFLHSNIKLGLAILSIALVYMFLVFSNNISVDKRGYKVYNQFKRGRHGCGCRSIDPDNRGIATLRLHSFEPLISKDMTVMFLCPNCCRYVSVQPISETSRNKEKAFYLCHCPTCNKESEVSIRIQDIHVESDRDKNFDRFGFSYN